MNWIETQIITASAGVDALCAMLTDLGIKGFSIADPADFQEFLQNKEGKWDYIDQDLLGMAQGDTTVTVYLPDNAQGAEQLVALRAMLAQIHARDDAQLFGTLELTLKNVREEDWANNWKQYFKPFTVGERLLIKPSWETCENPRNRAVLEIDPASSFGTGQHHTTRLCLELLEQLMHPGDRVLDLGCGSGILSIAFQLPPRGMGRKPPQPLQRRMPGRTTLTRPCTGYSAAMCWRMKRCVGRSVMAMI